MCLLKKLQLFSSFAFFIISYMCNTLGIYLHKAEPQTSSTGVKSCKVLQVYRCIVRCYRWCWRSQVSRLRPQTDNVQARNSSQDFLPFSWTHQAALPLLLLPYWPSLWCSCLCKETDVKVCRLWGMMPHQEWPLLFSGGEVTAQGPDMGLEEDFPVVHPGLWASLLLTPTQCNSQ